MKRISLIALLALIAAVAVLSAEVRMTSRLDQSTAANARSRSLFDEMVLIEARQDRELMLVVSGVTANFDEIVRLEQRSPDLVQTVQEVAPGLSLATIEAYRTAMQARRDHAEDIKTLVAHLRNETSYLPFLVNDYARQRGHTPEALALHRSLVELSTPQSYFQEHISDILSQTLAELQEPAQQDPMLKNALIHLTLLQEKRYALHEAMARYFAIDSTSALLKLRDEARLAYERDRKQAEAFSDLLSVLAVGLMLVLVVALIKMGRLQRSAEQARERLVNAVNSLEDGFILFGANGQTTLENTRFQDRLYGEHPAVAEPVANFGALLAALRQQCRGASELTEAVPVHDALIEQTATGRWLLFRSRPTTEGGHVCLLTDLTSSKKMEETIHTLWSAVEQNPLAIMISTAAGQIVYVNPRFTQLTGYNAAEMLGRSPDLLWRDADSAMVEGEIDKTLAAGLTWRGSLSNRLKSGESLRMEVTMAPVTAADGHISHFVTQMEDISAQQRTADLLLSTREENERILFAASHDFQEPVRTLLTYAQLLERQLGPTLKPDAARSLEFLRQGGVQLSQLVKGLLTFSRSNRPMATFVAVDCQKVVEQALADGLGAAARDAEIQQGSLPVVTGDPVLLGLLFEALFSNAIKFSAPERPLRLSVTARPEGHGWAVEIADNGIGIDPEYLESVFRPFSRLHPRALYPGAGLGLASARKIATYHGGTLTLQSVKGEGTVARLWLPSATPLPGPEAPAPSGSL